MEISVRPNMDDPVKAPRTWAVLSLPSYIWNKKGVMHSTHKYSRLLTSDGQTQSSRHEWRPHLSGESEEVKENDPGIIACVFMCVYLQYIPLGKMKGSSRNVDAFPSLHLE